MIVPRKDKKMNAKEIKHKLQDIIVIANSHPCTVSDEVVSRLAREALSALDEQPCRECIRLRDLIDLLDTYIHTLNSDTLFTRFRWIEANVVKPACKQPCSECGGNGMRTDDTGMPIDCPECGKGWPGPACETCGDTKKIYGDPYGGPCPACQPKPSGEMVSDLRSSAKVHKDMGKDFTASLMCKAAVHIEQLEDSEKRARDVAFQWQVIAQERREQIKQLEAEKDNLNEKLQIVSKEYTSIFKRVAEMEKKGE